VKNGEEIISILKRKDFDSVDILMWVMPEEPTDNQAFSENVIRKAPDFWRYRGNYYEFKEEDRGLTFEALEYYEKALEFFKEMEKRIETARTLMRIGDILILRGPRSRCY
jgi:hypothetical protein